MPRRSLSAWKQRILPATVTCPECGQVLGREQAAQHLWDVHRRAVPPQDRAAYFARHRVPVVDVDLRALFVAPGWAPIPPPRLLVLARHAERQRARARAYKERHR